jgi:hypothetical protein
MMDEGGGKLMASIRFFFFLFMTAGSRPYVAIGDRPVNPHLLQLRGCPERVHGPQNPLALCAVPA